MSLRREQFINSIKEWLEKEDSLGELSLGPTPPNERGIQIEGYLDVESLATHLSKEVFDK